MSHEYKGSEMVINRPDNGLTDDALLRDGLWQDFSNRCMD